LLKGTGAVISALGQPVGESSIFSDATRNILQAMDFYEIKRYILLTGLNVDTPGDNKSAYTAGGTAWMKANYPKTTADKQVEWEIIHASALDWTLVRLPLIELTEALPETIKSLTDCPGEKISSASLAVFLVNQIDSKNFLKQSPFIANR
jgi:NAD(P)H-binding